MLSPRYLAGLSDELIEIYSQLETDILCDMARRLSRVGKITEMTEYQARTLVEAGLLKQNIARVLKNYDRRILEELTAIFSEAMIKSIRADNRIFKEDMGRTLSDSQTQVMLASIKKVHSDLSRLTLTTAETGNYQFIRIANRAYMNVASGAFNFHSAIKQATDELAKEGLHTRVTYSNKGKKPVTRSIEAAVRMNVLTGVNQTAAAVSLTNCDELECDLVEVTAHTGSRPSHEAWQGKIYSISGKSNKYPPFSVCGYGEADGICGVNCRHSFYPYFEGQEKHYTQDDLDELSAQKVSYNGEAMSRYEGEQKLRHIERNIRFYKKKAAIDEAAELDNTKARVKIGEWQAKARDFTKQTGIMRDAPRERIGMKDGAKQPTALKPVERQNLTTPKTPQGMNGKAEVFTTATKNARLFVNMAINTQTMTAPQTTTITDGKRLEMALQKIKPKTDDISDIIKLQGFDGKPTVLSKDEFLKAVTDDTFIAQRTYTADTKQKLQGYVDMLRNGDFYVDCRVGGKAHGKGMYCAADFTKGKELRYIVEEMGHYQKIGMYQRGEQWTMTETIALHPSAKIIQESDVHQFYKDYLVKTYWEEKKKGGTMTMKELKRLITQSESRDDGVLAAAMGFDAIRADKYSRGADYVIVLNRTKLILLGGAK